MAFQCFPIQVCIGDLCCDSPAVAADLTITTTLIKQSAAPMCDPDGRIITTLTNTTTVSSTDGCVCSCPLPVNVMASDPTQAIPQAGTYYEVTVSRNGAQVFGPSRVRLDGDATYVLGSCGGVNVCDIMIDTPPLPPSDPFCSAVLACVGDITGGGPVDCEAVQDCVGPVLAATGLVAYNDAGNAFTLPTGATVGQVPTVNAGGTITYQTPSTGGGTDVNVQSVALTGGVLTVTETDASTHPVTLWNVVTLPGSRTGIQMLGSCFVDLTSGPIDGGGGAVTVLPTAVGWPEFTRVCVVNGVGGQSEYWITMEDTQGVMQWHQLA